MIDRIAPRSVAESHLTGIDDEIEERITEEQLAYARMFGSEEVALAATPESARSARPPVSLYTAIAQRSNTLMDQLEKAGSLCDATQRLCVSIEQAATRWQVGVKSLGVREARYSPQDGGSFRAGIYIADPDVPQDLRSAAKSGSLWEVICERNARLARVLDCVGIFGAIGTLVEAMRLYGQQKSMPVQRVHVKIDDGCRFIPSADGGELRMFFEVR